MLSALLNFSTNYQKNLSIHFYRQLYCYIGLFYNNVYFIGILKKLDKKFVFLMHFLSIFFENLIEFMCFTEYFKNPGKIACIFTRIFKKYGKNAYKNTKLILKIGRRNF